MAKKKSSSIRKQDRTTTNQQPAMEDPQEKLQNLKSLNEVLLKETLERRQQVESLLQAKEILETQLAQTAAEKTDYVAGFARESEERACLEIERGVFSVFIENEMEAMRVLVRSLMRECGEKDNEIRVLNGEIRELKVNLEGGGKYKTICQQRDRLMRDVEDWKKEANGLREEVIEMKEKKIQAEEELRKVKKFYDQSIEELKEKNKQFDEVRTLTDLAEKELAMKVNAIEELNRNMEEIVREKNEIEKENGEKKIKIGELEKELSEYSEILSSLRMEEGNLRGKLIELEKSKDEATDMVKEISRENDSLSEEKNEMERTIRKLTEEMESRERLVMNLNNELKDKDGLVETLLREKEEIEDVKVSKESEIVKLNGELVGLRDAMAGLQESIKVQEDQNAHLSSEVSHYGVTLEQLKLEKDNAERDLDEEMKKCTNLMSRVSEMEKRMEESEEEFAKMKSQYDTLIQEKRGMEGEVGLLKEEKDSVQNTLLEARREADDLRTKVESLDSISEKALFMIKQTAASLCHSENGKEVVSSTELKLDDETDPYATELEVIKSAFRSRETAVDEMKQQVRYLQNSIEEASKQKSLWAVVSSATTFLVAVSVAYVARLR